MIDLVKIECYKMIKRKDFYIMMSMIFIPILYAVGLAMNIGSITYVGKEKISGLSFATEMYVFVYMCFIYFVILSVCVIRSLKGEIENKSIQLYVQRIQNRKKLYLAKNMAYTILVIGNALLFLCISIVCFYLFLTSRSDIAVLELFRRGELSYCFIKMIGIVLSFLFTLNFSMFLSTYRRSFEAMGIFVFVWLASMYLKEFYMIQYFVPIYHLEKILNSNIENLQWNNFFMMLFLVCLYSLVSIMLGCKKFEKSDI